LEAENFGRLHQGHRRSPGSRPRIRPIASGILDSQRPYVICWIVIGRIMTRRGIGELFGEVLQQLRSGSPVPCCPFPRWPTDASQPRSPIGWFVTIANASPEQENPLCGPVDGFFLHGSFWFSSGRDSVRMRHLRERPAVTASHLPSEKLAVTVHGRAHLFELSDPVHQDLRQAMLDHYLPLQGPASKNGWTGSTGWERASRRTGCSPSASTIEADLQIR
jgi:hypothetical protein